MLAIAFKVAHVFNSLPETDFPRISKIRPKRKPSQFQCEHSYVVSVNPNTK